MDIVLHAFEGVFTVSLMVLAGYYLGSHHWFSEESLNLISKLITKICLPLYMIVNLTETLTHDTVIQMSSGLPVAVSSMIICFIIGQLAVRFAKIPKGRRGVLAAVFCNQYHFNRPAAFHRTVWYKVHTVCTGLLYGEHGGVLGCGGPYYCR